MRHTAPIAVIGGMEYDPRDGDYPYPGREQFHAVRLIERFARKHQIPWNILGGMDEYEYGQRRCSGLGRSYPGGAPFFARSAVSGFNPNQRRVRYEHQSIEDARRLSYSRSGWTRFRPSDLAEHEYGERLPDPGIYYISELRFT